MELEYCWLVIAARSFLSYLDDVKFSGCMLYVYALAGMQVYMWSSK